MPFPYYDRLSAKDKEIYRMSDAVASVRLPEPESLRPFVETLEVALGAEDRRGATAAAGFLCRGLTRLLQVPPVSVQVLAVRPKLRSAELHGLYTRDGRAEPLLQVWMRTAQKQRVVAFRTFLRTVLHEITHHLDYELLELRDSFHTEGFFKRESSLFHQLVPRSDDL